MTTRIGPTLRGMCLATLISLVAGCALLPPPDPARPSTDPTRRVQPTPGASLPTESDPPIYDGPAEPDLRAIPVMRSEHKENVMGIALRPDGIVLADRTRPAFALGVDGKIRWTLTNPVRLSSRVTAATLVAFGRSVDGATNPVIAAAYAWDPCDVDFDNCRRDGETPTTERGIAAFSAETGSLLWSIVLEPLRYPDEGEAPDENSYRVEIVSEAAVLIEVTPDQGQSDPVEDKTALALDPRTGKRLWSTKGMLVEEAGGDRVLGRLARPGSGGEYDFEGYPVVLDATTGNQIWRSAELATWGFGSSSEIDNGSDEFAVAELGGEVGTKPDGAIIVDLATGQSYPVQQGGVVGRDAAGPFHSWIKIERRRFLLDSAELPEGTPRRGQQDAAVTGFTGTTGGYLWVLGLSRDGDTIALDRTGARRVAVPGLLRSASEAWLVTMDHESRQILVHRLQRAG